MVLDEDQTDALVEIFNISIGRAAASMSSLVNEEITMTVPTLKFLPIDEAVRQLPNLDGGRVCGVAQHFRGPFATEALLMFPEDKSLEIVRMMLGESYSMDELSELEQEAMGEIGNIILNACIGSIANITGSSFDSTLPEVRMGGVDEMMRIADKGTDEAVLIIYIDFIIARRTIHGYLAFMMDVPSVQGLIDSIDKFLESLSS